MRKIIQLAEEIIPLTKQQAFFGIIIISCLFQFILFDTPALAQEAVRAITETEQSSAPEETIAFTLSLSKSFSTKGFEDDLTQRLAITKANKQVVSSNSYLLNNKPNGEIDDLLLKEEELLVNDRKIALLSKPEILGPTIKVIRTSFHTLTAYNSEPGQTDDTPCITANNFDVCAHGIEDTIAANFLKFGTKVRIPELFGDRIFIVRDRMNRRYPERVDVWMLSKTEARQFGVKRATIEIIEVIEAETKINNTQNLISRR